jgi:hypothetical protein
MTPYFIKPCVARTRRRNFRTAGFRQQRPFCCTTDLAKHGTTYGPHTNTRGKGHGQPRKDYPCANIILFDMEGALCLISRRISLYILQQDFDRIIRAYFPNDRVGSRHIQQGNYYVSRAGSSQIIRPSELGNSVEAGMVLEMSVVLRREEILSYFMKRCPRCQNINRTRVPVNGWIEW